MKYVKENYSLFQFQWFLKAQKELFYFSWKWIQVLLELWCYETLFKWF